LTFSLSFQAPEATFAQTSKAVGMLWKETTNKTKYEIIYLVLLFVIFQLLTDNTNNFFFSERYETLAAADKERYKNDMEIYEVIYY